MKREEHLKFCKNCTKQQFDTRNGIVCSITNKIADFENECPNYEKEEIKTVKKELNYKAIKLLMQNEEFKISSTANFIGLFLGTILILAMTPLLIWMTIGMDFHFGMVFGILIYTALIFFTTYQFFFTCDARVKGDKVILKKLLDQLNHIPLIKSVIQLHFNIKELNTPLFAWKIPTIHKRNILL